MMVHSCRHSWSNSTEDLHQSQTPVKVGVGWVGGGGGGGGGGGVQRKVARRAGQFHEGVPLVSDGACMQV